MGVPTSTRLVSYAPFLLSQGAMCTLITRRKSATKMASSSTTLAAINGCQELSLPPQEPLRVSGPCSSLGAPEGPTSLHSDSGLKLPQCVRVSLTSRSVGASLRRQAWDQGIITMEMEALMAISNVGSNPGFASFQLPQGNA